MSDFLGKGEVFSAIWVDVENEGLPPIDSKYGVHLSENVLVHLATIPGVTFGDIKIGYWDADKKAWFGIDSSKLEKDHLVTHWMKLPKSPWQPHPNAGDKFKPASSL